MLRPAKTHCKNSASAALFAHQQNFTRCTCSPRAFANHVLHYKGEEAVVLMQPHFFDSLDHGNAAEKLEALSSVRFLVAGGLRLHQQQSEDAESLLGIVQCAFAQIFRIAGQANRHARASSEAEEVVHLMLRVIGELFDLNKKFFHQSASHLHAALYVNEILSRAALGGGSSQTWDWGLRVHGLSVVRVVMESIGPTNTRKLLPGVFSRCCKDLSVDDTRVVPPKQYVTAVCSLLTASTEAALPLSSSPDQDVGIEADSSTGSSATHSTQHWIGETCLPLQRTLHPVLNVLRLSAFHHRPDARQPLPLLRLVVSLLVRFAPFVSTSDSAVPAAKELVNDLVLAIGVLWSALAEEGHDSATDRVQLALLHSKSAMASLCGFFTRAVSSSEPILDSATACRVLPGIFAVLRIAGATEDSLVQQHAYRLLRWATSDAHRVLAMEHCSHLPITLCIGSIAVESVGALVPCVSLLKMLGEVCEMDVVERIIEEVVAVLDDWDQFERHPSYLFCVTVAFFRESKRAHGSTLAAAERFLGGALAPHLWRIADDAHLCNAQQLRFRYCVVAIILYFFQSVVRHFAVPPESVASARKTKRVVKLRQRLTRWFVLTLYEILEKLVSDNGDIQRCAVNTLAVYGAVFRSVTQTDTTAAVVPAVQVCDSALVLFAHMDYVLDGALRGVESGDSSAPEVLHGFLREVCFGASIGDQRKVSIANDTGCGGTALPLLKGADIIILVSTITDRVMASLQRPELLHSGALEGLLRMLHVIVRVIQRVLSPYDGQAGVRLGEEEVEDRCSPHGDAKGVISTLQHLLWKILEELRSVALTHSSPRAIVLLALLITRDGVEALRLYVSAVDEECNSNIGVEEGTPLLQSLSILRPRDVHGKGLPTLHKLYVSVVSLLLPVTGITVPDVTNRLLPSALAVFESVRMLPQQGGCAFSPAFRRQLHWLKALEATSITESAISTLMCLCAARVDFMAYRTCTEVLKLVMAWICALRMHGPPWAQRQRRVVDTIHEQVVPVVKWIVFRHKDLLDAGCKAAVVKDLQWIAEQLGREGAPSDS